MAEIFLRLLIFTASLYCVTAVGGNDNQDTSTENSNSILPVVFVKYNNEFHYPTALTRTIPLTDSRLAFTYNNQTGQQYFCPVETEPQRQSIQKGLELSETYSKIVDLKKTIRINNPQSEEYFKYLEFSNQCLFQKSFFFNWKNLPTCPQEPAFSMRQMTLIENGEQKVMMCGPNDAGKMYEIFYLVCPSTNIIQKFKMISPQLYTTQEEFRNFVHKLPFTTVKHVVYRFCYNHDKKDTIFTKHRLRTDEILFDKRLKNEREHNFPMITEGYQYFSSDDFENIKQIFEEVEDMATKESNPETQDNDATVLPKPEDHKARKLVSHEDFPTALWRKPTFHYLNLKPMHKKLIPLWEYMEKFLRNYFRKLKIELEVYTGAFNVSDEKTKPVQYMKNDQLPIPEEWVKLIYDADKTTPKRAGLVIKMLNYIATEPDPKCVDDWCHPHLDNGIIEKQFPGAGHQICCERVTVEHLKLFNLNNLQIDSVLVIHSLNFIDKSDED